MCKLPRLMPTGLASSTPAGIDGTTTTPTTTATTQSRSMTQSANQGTEGATASCAGKVRTHHVYVRCVVCGMCMWCAGSVCARFGRRKLCGSVVDSGGCRIQHARHGLVRQTHACSCHRCGPQANITSCPCYVDTTKSPTSPQAPSLSVASLPTAFPVAPC